MVLTMLLSSRVTPTRNLEASKEEAVAQVSIGLVWYGVVRSQRYYQRKSEGIRPAKFTRRGAEYVRRELVNGKPSSDNTSPREAAAETLDSDPAWERRYETVLTMGILWRRAAQRHNNCRRIAPASHNNGERLRWRVWSLQASISASPSQTLPFASHVASARPNRKGRS